MTIIFQLYDEVMQGYEVMQTKDRVKKVWNGNQAFTPDLVSGLDSKDIKV